MDADAYSAEEVVILSLPVSLPYPIHDATYERANGEVEYRGEFYHLVKQKVERDTLFMVCVKDREQKRIETAINEYANISNNLPAGTKHTLDFFGKLFKDYTSAGSTETSLKLELKYDFLFAFYSQGIIKHVFPVDSPPPELG
jgi:hypothetical protein